MAAPTDSMVISAMTDGVTALPSDYIPIRRGATNRYITPPYIASYARGGGYYPETYGAVGDGVADDSVSIIDAISAAGVSGGVVQGRSGSIYKVTTQGSISGDSLVTPYCTLVNAAKGHLLLNNLKLFLADGQASNSIPLLIRGSSGAKRTNKTVVRNCEVYSNPATQIPWTDFGMFMGIYADNLVFENNYIHDSPFFGAQIFRASENALVWNNRFVYSAYGSGFRHEILTGRIFGNIFEGDPAVTKTCLDLSCNSDIALQGEGLQVIGNLFKAGYILISLAGQRGTIIANNELRGAINTNSVAITISHYSHGTNPYNATNCIVVDNVIRGCRQGITITGSATNGVTGCIIARNQMSEEVGQTPSFANGIIEDNRATVGQNVIKDNIIRGATTPFTLAGAPANGTRKGGNLAYNDSNVLIYCDEAGGSGTIASGATSAVITHGLGQTPQARNISVSPTNNPANDPGNAWISAITSTQFTVNCRADPGAGGLAFDWQAAVL